MLGEAGLVLIGYMGQARGKYRGPISCHWYEIDPDRRFMYLDARDADHFLKLRGPNGEELFCRA